MQTATSARPHRMPSGVRAHRDARSVWRRWQGQAATQTATPVRRHSFLSSCSPRREFRVEQMASTDCPRAAASVRLQVGGRPRLSEVRVPCGVVDVDEQQFGPRHRHGRMSP